MDWRPVELFDIGDIIYSYSRLVYEVIDKVASTHKKKKGYSILYSFLLNKNIECTHKGEEIFVLIDEVSKDRRKEAKDFILKNRKSLINQDYKKETMNN